MSALALIEAHADAVFAALAEFAPEGTFAGLHGSELLTERARLGATPAVRSCRLLEARDGWLALNLAREDDWALLPAWLETEIVPEWDAVHRAARWRSAAGLVERGREIGLAVALDWPPQKRHQVAGVVGASLAREMVAPKGRSDNRRARVIDLSSLWAGPLCGRLLAQLGAEVIKVESRQRPDGARRGASAFFDALNRDKVQVALDFATASGRRELEMLLHSADIVIEASRPRALRQLGIDADHIVAETPGLIWISITGYGRDPPRENWIAYGDDAGVAAGLAHLHWQLTGERVIVGDAVADPLTGIEAALAAWQGFRSGGAGLVSLALRDVVARSLAACAPYWTRAGVRRIATGGER